MNMSRALQTAVAVAVAALTVMRPSIVRACSVVGPVPHQVNPALAATDTAAPALTEQTKVEAFIFDSGNSGCGSHSSCEGIAMINLKVSVLDDQSPPERIGYRLNVVGGTVPPGIGLPQFDTVAFNDIIAIPWSPSLSGESFRFELSVAPIDEAGNVGDTQRVVVERIAGGGCAMNPMNPGTGASDPTFRIAAIAMVAATMLRLRRRRGAK
jgi:hypothetical protein